MNKIQKEKKMGLLGATAIGIGGMVGGGIFAVLGTAVSLAKGQTPVAFVFAGIVALLTAYAYAKLSVEFPDDGGTVTFIDKAFGINLITSSVNFLLWISYLITISLYAVAFASYAGTFFSCSSIWLKHLLICIAILLPTVINLMNADIIGKYELYIVGIKVILLIVVIVAGIPYVNFAKIDFSIFPNPFSLIAAGMVIFVAYEGFELISNAGGDVKNPKRTLPLAIYSSVISVIILYILIAVITVGSVPLGVLEKSKDFALAVAAKPALGHFGFTIVAIAAILATFSAINASIYGNARLGFKLANDKELLNIAGEKTNGKPIKGVLLILVLSLLIANFINLTGIAIMGSAGFLIIFFTINLACLKMGKKIKALRIIPLFGALACLLATIILFIHTYEDNPHALYIVIIMLVFSFLFEFFYKKIQKKTIN
jgi:amino acid transporter